MDQSCSPRSLREFGRDCRVPVVLRYTNVATCAARTHKDAHTQNVRRGRSVVGAGPPRPGGAPPSL